MSQLPVEDARLVDRSLARVEQRRGVGTSMAALMRHTARRILGLRRPLRYKLLPLVFAGHRLPARHRVPGPGRPPPRRDRRGGRARAGRLLRVDPVRGDPVHRAGRPAGALPRPSPPHPGPDPGQPAGPHHLPGGQRRGAGRRPVRGDPRAAARGPGRAGAARRARAGAAAPAGPGGRQRGGAVPAARHGRDRRGQPDRPPGLRVGRHLPDAGRAGRGQRGAGRGARRTRAGSAWSTW